VATTPQFTFRQVAARTRKSAVYTIAAPSPGSTVTQQLNNTGYLEALWVTCFGTATVTGAGGTVTDARAAQTNLLPRIVLRSPQGEIIVSSSSKDIVDFNKRLFPADIDLLPGKVVWNPAVAGAYNFVLQFKLPVALNDGMNFAVGQLMRQISNNFFYLDITFAQNTDLVGAGTAVVALTNQSVQIGETYYDSIPAGANVVPPDFTEFVRLRSQSFSPLAQGQNIVAYATNPVLTDAQFRIVNNGAADGTVADLSYIETTTNFGTVIDHRTGLDYVRDNYLAYEKAEPAGVYLLDFNDDFSIVNATQRRDWINSQNVANLQFNVQYAGVPGGINQIQMLFREIVQASA